MGRGALPLRFEARFPEEELFAFRRSPLTSNLQPNMSLNLQIINPITYADWNELVLSNQDYSFFHTSNWASVLTESYNYNPLYFSLVDGKELSCLIPLMEIKSFVTGQRGVSLPFTDYCNPICNKDIDFHDAFKGLIEYGKKTGWKYIEIRGGEDILKNVPHYTYCYIHTLNLSKTEKQIFSTFRSSTRRNIRKAIKEGVEVGINNTLDSLEDFFRLNCMTRKMHGLPPQPYSFFEKIYEYIIKKELGNIFLVSYEGKTIAGAIFFHFGKRALFKYGASDKKYQHLRANNFVMWAAIKRYAQNDFKSLCFGRTEPENKGLRQFKVGWGTEEKIIKYYRYDIKKMAFINGGSHVSGFHNKVFNKMPIPLLKGVGSLFYKHMG